MALSRDPTRTRHIERRWLREVTERWSNFTRTVIDELDIDQQAANDYMLFFTAAIERILIESQDPPDWQSKYQLQAYSQAIRMTNDQMRRQGFRIPQMQEEEENNLLPFLLFGLAATIDHPRLAPASVIPFTDLVHTNELDFLFTRSHDALVDAGSLLDRQTRQILVDGVRTGRTEAELIAAIKERIDVSKSSAERIARTETIQAFQRGAINQSAVLAAQLDEDVGLRWVTQNDNVVRPLHRSWHGKIFTREQALINIQISPWNCRCSLIPVVVPAVTAVRRWRQFKRDNARFKRERKTLVARGLAKAA